MCDHGTTGAVFTLALLKRTALGEIRIETQVGQVSAIFDQNGTGWKLFLKEASNCWVASSIPASQDQALVSAESEFGLDPYDPLAMGIGV